MILMFSVILSLLESHANRPENRGSVLPSNELYKTFGYLPSCLFAPEMRIFAILRISAL